MSGNKPVEVELIDVEAVIFFVTLLAFIISLIADWLGYGNISEITAKIAVYAFVGGFIYVIIYYLTAGIKSLFSKNKEK